MKNKSYQYYKVKPEGGSLTLEFDSLRDFHRFAESHHHKTVFLLNGTDGVPAHFALAHNGSLLMQASEGFRTLEDFTDAEARHFPDASTYYKAVEAGYKDYDDYKLVMEAGIADKQVFDEMKEQGFTEGWHDWHVLKKEAAIPDVGEMGNPHELFAFSKKMGFANYTDLKSAMVKGFTDADTFRIAKEKLYQNAADFEAGQKEGYVNATDFEKARQISARGKDDYLKWINLEMLKSAGLAHDQRVLLVLLSKLEQRKKASINKLLEAFEKEKEEYVYADSGEMPPWFTTTFKGREDIVDFLKKSPEVNKYGHYDSDGEYFEINRLQERAVVIDGSNVAHASHGNNKSKPKLENIIKVVKELKRRGFVSITVIADASLKHRITDADKMTQLEALAQYLEAPAENPADIFIIQYVKRTHCLLVSNDTFREWKGYDSWVAANIDFYRLAFMIKGDNVLMPDLDKADV